MKYNGEELHELIELLSEDAEKYDPYVYSTKDVSKVMMDMITKAEDDRWDGFILLFNEPKGKGSYEIESVVIPAIEAFVTEAESFNDLRSSYDFAIYSGDITKNCVLGVEHIVNEIKAKLKAELSKLKAENAHMSRLYYMAMCKYFSGIVD